jgi:hypothetical protein
VERGGKRKVDGGVEIVCNCLIHPDCLLSTANCLPYVAVVPRQHNKVIGST